MSFASFANVANSTANLTARLANTATELLENRAKFHTKPSRSAREAEGKLRPRVQKCPDRLARLAEAQTQEAPAPAKSLVPDCCPCRPGPQAVAERTMPVQESPYETEAYERLKAMNSLELTRLAIRSRTDYGIHDPHRRERLLLAGGWIIRWTEDLTGASDPDIRSFDHTGHPYDTWDGFITALSCQTQPEAPTDLRPLVEQAPPGDATVHLSDMTPIQVREFAMRFHRAAVIELDQRPHTVPKRMRQPATAALRSLAQPQL